jgi:bacillithiol system protein YtxJ
VNWNKLEKDVDLSQIDEESKQSRILILKHSTRCSISSAVLNRLERNWSDVEMSNIKPYFLDLLAYRSISNHIAEHYHIDHQSPQVLVIENGKCIYTESHGGIMYEELKALAN